MPASRDIDWVTIRAAYEETTEPVAVIAGRFGDMAGADLQPRSA